jgi:hypothetical protein
MAMSGIPGVSAADLAATQAQVAREGLATAATLQRDPATGAVAGTPGVWQTVSAAGLTCHVVPTTQRYQIASGVRLADETAWAVLFPHGTDVRPGDQVQALGAAYSVLEVQEPRSLDLVVRTLCLRLGPVALDGTITPTYLQPNATVTIDRKSVVGAANGTNRRVRLEDPSPDQRILPEGAEVALVLYDHPGADYRQDDIVTITQVDGFTGTPTPHKYSVGEVDFVPAPWPLVRVQLTGTSRGGAI